MKIKEARAYQILDSRGRPTVACRITLEDGSNHAARVPSGASTGRHEALELRDHGTPLAERFYGGSSVFQAVKNVNEIIAARIVGMDAKLEKVDDLLVELDPTPNHGALGANAKLSVSLATAIAEAHAAGNSLARHLAGPGPLQIPMPMVNILSGGAHANRTLDIQDVLVIPHRASSFTEALSWIAAIRETATKLGRAQGLVTHLVADEGGLGIPFLSVAAACDFVVRCISEVGLAPGKDVSLALDFAATQYFENDNYQLRSEGLKLDPVSYQRHILNLVNTQPIVSIEDPFAEDDWISWQLFSASAPKGLQILGDDLFTTNMQRLEQGIETKAANAILIKVNQNGLVSHTAAALKRAQEANFKTIVSARSGETEDSWLADLAIGWRAGQIKVGSTHGSERTAKWNRLLEIEATEESSFARPFAKL